VHNNATIRAGFGDVAFLVKYRLLSANEEYGNYIVTAFLGWSLPTGDHENGGRHAVITLAIAYEKEFGNFAVQGTFGVGLLLIRTVWDEPALGTTHFNIGCSGSCGLKSSSTQHSFRAERTMARSRIL
jgi:hypothetical protein